MKGPMFGRTDGRTDTMAGETIALYLFCLEWPRIPLNKYQVFCIFVVSKTIVGPPSYAP